MRKIIQTILLSIILCPLAFSTDQWVCTSSTYPDGDSAYNSNTGYIYDGDLYYCLAKSANNGNVSTYAYVRYSGYSKKY